MKYRTCKESMFYLKQIILVSLIVLFVCCNNGAEPEGASGIDVHIDNTKFNILQEVSPLESRSFNVEEEFAGRMSDYIQDFLLVENTVLIVDRYKNRLAALDFSGQLLWEKKAGDVGPGMVNSIGLVDYNPYKKHIEVYDNDQLTVFSYDLNGEYVSRENVDLNFSDRQLLGEDVTAYDIGDYANSFYTGEDRFRMIFLSGKGTRLIQRLPPKVEGVLTYNDGNRFNTYGESIFYSPEFSNQLYKVSEEKGIELRKNIIFESGGDTREVLVDRAVKRKASHIFREEMPFVKRLVEVDNGIAGIYSHRNFSHFLYQRDMLRIDCLGLLVNGEYVGRPAVYADGYILCRMSKSEESMVNLALQSKSNISMTTYQDVLEKAGSVNKIESFKITLIKL